MFLVTAVIQEVKNMLSFVFARNVACTHPPLPLHLRDLGSISHFWTARGTRRTCSTFCRAFLAGSNAVARAGASHADSVVCQRHFGELGRSAKVNVRHLANAGRAALVTRTVIPGAGATGRMFAASRTLAARHEFTGSEALRFLCGAAHRCHWR